MEQLQMTGDKTSPRTKRRCGSKRYCCMLGIIIFLLVELNTISWTMIILLTVVGKMRLAPDNYITDQLEVGTSVTPPVLSSKLVTVGDYEKYAETYMDKDTWLYLQDAAMEKITFHENLRAFKRYRFLPQHLYRDVTNVDTSRTVQQQQVTSPIGVCPMGYHRIFHPDGEAATGRAAQDAGVILILSEHTTTSMEEMVKAAPHGIKWQQLTIYKPLNITLNFVRKAEAAGYKAIVITIDRPVSGKWSYLSRKNPLDPDLLDTVMVMRPDFDNHSYAYFKKIKYSQPVYWEDITWLKNSTSLKVVVKGVLTPEEAVAAVKHGADGIIVSNHGGRVLDGTPASIDVLESIVLAVNGTAEVYLDSGIRSGVDVFRALALGARAVFVGRPILWGLFANSTKGVHDVLTIMTQELRETMALNGAPTLDDISRQMLYKSDSTRVY